ncbi:hypothetical protein MJH12_14490, partial [bacterium]|nr:hypothetical protein [bacterium]
FLENVSNLGQRICRYKMMVCSGGITAYEALKSGCIPLMIAQNQEQEDTATNIVEQELGYYFGKSNNFDEKSLISVLNEGFDSELADSISRRFQKLNGEDSTTLVVELLIEHGQSGKL